MNFSKKHIKAIARNADGGFVLDYYGLYLTIARNFSNNKAFFRWMPVTASLKHGKWIPVEPDSRGCTLRFACSVCGNYTTYYEDAHECDYDYCPNCGAKMDEGESNV